MKKVLFLCTGNSCRSQMAHGFAEAYQSELFETYSAGIEAHGLNPYAVKVMSEANVDISQNKSQTLSELSDIEFDCVVTVCDHAASNCPTFEQNCLVIHHQFDDPPKLAAQYSEEQAKLDCFRQVRDEIETWLGDLPEMMKSA